MGGFGEAERKRGCGGAGGRCRVQSKPFEGSHHKRVRSLLASPAAEHRGRVWRGRAQARVWRGGWQVPSAEQTLRGFPSQTRAEPAGFASSGASWEGLARPSASEGVAGRVAGAECRANPSRVPITNACGACWLRQQRSIVGGFGEAERKRGCGGAGGRCRVQSKPFEGSHHKRVRSLLASPAAEHRGRVWEPFEGSHHNRLDRGAVAASQNRVLGQALLVLRMVQIVVQAAAFGSATRALDDELGHQGDVA